MLVQESECLNKEVAMEDSTESADHTESAVTYHNIFAPETRQLYTGLRIANDIEDGSGLRWMKTDNKEAGKIDDAVLTICAKKICVTCGLEFEDRPDQVAHFHSDWHHFNLKRKIYKGLSPVSKEKFEEIADDVSSISGSDSTSDTDSEIDQAEPMVKDASQCDLSLPRLPMVYFRNQEGELLSIYRCTLADRKNDEADLARLVSRAHRVDRWAVLMLGGGHFAGAVFQKCDVVVHKTFHRYTVRAKGGRAQGLCDQKGGCAKSAGSSLRRYNEAALVQDVQDLLSTWSDHLKLCNIIFVRAASYNKAILFAHKNPPFSRADDRIRKVPFPTRRPTMSEVKRVHKLLSSVSNYGQSRSLSDVLKASPKRRTDPKPEVVEQLPETIDKRSAEDDQCSSSDGEIELTWMQETFSTSHLRDFEMTKKPRRRKKKSVNEEKHTDASRRVNKIIPDNVQKLRDQIFTACKTGNLQTLLNIARSAPQSLPSNAVVPLGSGMRTDTNDAPSAMNSHMTLPDDGEPLPSNSASLGNESPCTGDGSSVPLIQLPERILSLRFGNREETILHVTSRADEAEMTYKLLEMGADPTIKDVCGLVPYAVCKSKLTRNEFRRFMAGNPDRYDYMAAQVPAPLTEEMEAERKARDVERKKQIKKAKKIRQKDQREKDLAFEAEQREKDRYLKLSDREKRALAAERRLLGQVETSGGVKPTLSRCFQCAEDITGKVPFEYYEYKFCTTKCLRLHRAAQTTGKS